MPVPPVVTVVVDDLASAPPGIVCCAGYEKGMWRKDRLVKHLLDWLPDFALTPDEKAVIDPLRPYRTLEVAARRFFTPDPTLPRGELGELLIHTICVQEFRTRQFVSRLFYKMRTNDQVTGFDTVHLRYIKDNDELELWLGEAKLYKNFSSGLSSAMTSLSAHIDDGFLNETKALIGPKIAKSDPLFDKLSWIFDQNVSLDEVVDRMVVPVLIAADCTADSVIGSMHRNYLNENKTRLASMRQKLLEKYDTQLSIVAIYFPLNNKEAFEAEFVKRLSALT